ncbi:MULTISPECIES: NAD-dependent epimerase/dehydratase family protein [Pseudomonas]|uniref:3-beta hydroxysteroid dehydrogenase n=1 Tax=Pseudomonas protegens TaxID=380021 RepID=A0A2T6GIT4_9PSED|nr:MULTISPECIES: NAD-dependent epimerase/dehydratase family protein [Pseudomonas]PUA44064.1 3-beta hydroxysteroid dehydrogenase [Pseudomonas protegens]RXU62742.1 3-beta hydroxysteroid dehydrogenase [Pseudomonas protegens]ULT72105.1 NAD-dependent epimerase/dehydratase family protein [Pseudomonas sp. BC42]BAQ76493.1 3-beta hydroxysteroid dehydrogenase/isomerase family protein [Pseudomonas sp. Os17]BAQ82689.1 3-beta hydroxysteroid dehydrogenase/isomerase family protein [Pseudomonas sp. St29]
MKILVTGASGFIGGRFARFALEQGLEVRVNGRRAEAVEHLVRRGAEFIPGDLSDADLVRELCRDVDTVVHCAGAVGLWGRYQDFHLGNVLVTENVVEACLKQRVQRLVHLSSPSVYFDGRDHLGLTEEQVPKRFKHPYAATKFLAEQKVFGAQEFGLEVIALRPRFVTGAGDMSIFPRLLKMQRKGRLAIVGNGLNKVDFTSVHNLNEALFSSLQVGGSALGKVYNISNGAPVPLWDVVNYVMRQMQVPQVTRYRSFGLAYSVAALNEGFCKLWPGRPEPTLSRLGMQVMDKNFTLDISRARHYLGYEPKVSLWSALDEFCTWWKAQDIS